MTEADDRAHLRLVQHVAYEWHKDSPLGTYCQRSRYLKAMVDQCMAEAMRHRENSYDQNVRLNNAAEILDGIWLACAPDLAREFWDRSKWPEDKRAELTRQNETMWTRYDPLQIYQKGYEGAGYPGVSRKTLANNAAKYLSCPWLRIPALDWLMVDAFVTDELAQYGEHLKRTHLPGPEDLIERIKFDEATKGDHAAMVRLGRRYRKRPVVRFLGVQILLPVVGVATAVYFEAWKTALAVAALFVLDLAWIAFRQVVLLARRMRATPEQLRTASQVDHARFNGMREVWRLLEGPVVNPTLLRAEMVKTTDNSAVWESAAWAIVDRQIGIDPAVWVTTIP
jgi:hypothetical protein